MKLKISRGDVFRFPVSGKAWGYVHVIISDIIQYVVVYEPIFNETPALDALRSSPILLSGWTSDAKIYVGDWEIVGTIEPPAEIRFPIYKVNIYGETWVTDVNGKALRVATSKEAAELPFQSSSSPITYEEAFKAYHGLGPWESYFDKLLSIDPRTNENWAIRLDR